MNIFLKANHWILLLLMIFLCVTGVFGLTIFHYSSLIPRLEFAYGVNEIQGAGRASQVFIARLVRGLLWDTHYYAGIALSVSAFFAIFFGGVSKFFVSFKKNPFPFIFLILVIVLLCTGILRHYRGDISWMGEQDRFWRDLTRKTHYWSAWILVAAVALHIFHMIRLNLKKHTNLIGNMFRGGGFILRSTIFSILFLTVGDSFASTNQVEVHAHYGQSKIEKDKYFVEGNAFYHGQKGFKWEERSFPACPYDACEKNSDAVVSYEKDGMRYYTIKIHDFKSAKRMFDKAVEENQNPLAAEKNLIMLMERVNYKDALYDPILLDHVRDSLGVSGAASIKNEIKKNIIFIGSEENSCKVLYKAGEIYEKGYFDVAIDLDRAHDLYLKASKKCEQNNLYFVLSNAKVSR